MLLYHQGVWDSPKMTSRFEDNTDSTDEFRHTLQSAFEICIKAKAFHCNFYCHCMRHISKEIQHKGTHQNNEYTWHVLQLTFIKGLKNKFTESLIFFNMSWAYVNYTLQMKICITCITGDERVITWKHSVNGRGLKHPFHASLLKTAVTDFRPIKGLHYIQNEREGLFSTNKWAQQERHKYFNCDNKK